MKMTKIIATALAFTIVCGAAPLGSSAPVGSTAAAADTEDENVTTGTCGEGVTWTVSKVERMQEGQAVSLYTLTIGGNGALTREGLDPEKSGIPKLDYLGLIIEEGIMSIGEGAFADFAYMDNNNYPFGSVTVRSRDCEIFDSEDTLPIGWHNYGYAGSTFTEYIKKRYDDLSGFVPVPYQVPAKGNDIIGGWECYKTVDPETGEEHEVEPSERDVYYFASHLPEEDGSYNECAGILGDRLVIEAGWWLSADGVFSYGSFPSAYDGTDVVIGNSHYRKLEHYVGDPNGDGKADAKDASFVLAEYAKLSTGGESELARDVVLAADVNRDDKLDAKDASILLAYYAYTSTTDDATDPALYLYYNVISKKSEEK